MKNPCWIFNLVWVYTCMANKDDETSEFHHEPVSNKWYFLTSFVKKDGKHFLFSFMHIHFHAMFRAASVKQ